MEIDTSELMKVSSAEKALAFATTPEQSKNVESVAAAAIAWAKEQGDYELAVEAARVYILARRKTTELIEPNIYQFHGNRFVGSNEELPPTLEDFGFSKMQWLRRRRELEVSAETLNEYIDTCIEKNAIPSAGGMCALADKRAEEDKEPEGRFLLPHQQAQELAMAIIEGAIREQDKDWLLSDDCRDYFEELNLPIDFTLDYVETGFLPSGELIIHILRKRLKENQCPKNL